MCKWECERRLLFFFFLLCHDVATPFYSTALKLIAEKMLFEMILFLSFSEFIDTESLKIRRKREAAILLPFKAVAKECVRHHGGLLDGTEAVDEDVHFGLDWDA